MSEPVVTVKQGALRGAKVESATGVPYNSFKGISFAAPPIGDLRFRDPQPPQPWKGVRDAITEGSKAAQFDAITNTIVGDDDCLYLNVATTALTGSRPVMVWIHGGAFLWGDRSFDTYGPDYIMGSGVVYVSISYRLGVLGFLNLDDKVAPGNMGLKDQVAALKWVRDNIAQFGGDPNNVTIFGESAGGASVHYLLLSPLAKGLFHKAIMQSGVVLNPFACVSETLGMAHRYVVALGRNITDPKDIVEYLRTVPVHRLIEVQENMSTPQERVTYAFPFGPGVDNTSLDPFMSRSPEEVAAEGFDIPVIIGYTSHEGLFFLSDVYMPPELQEKGYQMLDENLEMALPRDLAAKAPSKISEIACEIRKFYFGDKRITKDLSDEFVKWHGNLNFLVGIHKVVEIQRPKKSPTYFYKFSYDGPNSIAKKILQVHAKGATHTEELYYIFFATQLSEHIKMKPGSTERLVRDKFIRMWTDFAKTGNPTPSIDDLITERWEPVSETNKNYLEINAEFSTGVDLDKDVWKTWKGFYAMADDQ